MIRRMGEFTLKEKKKQKYSELIRMEPVFFVMDWLRCYFSLDISNEKMMLIWWLEYRPALQDFKFIYNASSSSTGGFYFISILDLSHC